MKKFLILGSAGYVKDWYNANGKRFIDDGHILCAINNAWAVDPENVRIWFRSEDFFLMPNGYKPTEAQRAKWFEVVKVIDTPIFYRKGKGGGTMILNVLCHLLNHAFYCKDKFWMALAGCDCNYKGQNSWFYGQGQPDPIRSMGEQCLIEELGHLKVISENQGCTIVNVGEQGETLLPFARWQYERA